MLVVDVAIAGDRSKTVERRFGVWQLAGAESSHSAQAWEMLRLLWEAYKHHVTTRICNTQEPGQWTFGPLVGRVETDPGV